LDSSRSDRKIFFALHIGFLKPFRDFGYALDVDQIKNRLFPLGDQLFPFIERPPQLSPERVTVLCCLSIFELGNVRYFECSLVELNRSLLFSNHRTEQVIFFNLFQDCAHLSIDVQILVILKLLNEAIGDLIKFGHFFLDL